jgi:hypothetical protein
MNGRMLEKNTDFMVDLVGDNFVNIGLCIARGGSENESSILINIYIGFTGPLTGVWPTEQIISLPRSSIRTQVKQDAIQL